jgi:hypothetical protein
MTPERVRRDDDERLYQPRIHSRHIRALHQISVELGEPMTVLVDQALSQYIERYRQTCHEEWLSAFPELDQASTPSECISD